LQSVWRWGKEKSEKEKDSLLAYEGNDGEIRIFQKERKLSQMAKTVLADKEIISNKGTKELQALLGKGIFDFPKPVALIKLVTTIGSNEDSLILDFFSGSATTAHAVMQLNAEDGGARKFIMVQMSELTDIHGEAFRAGFKSIADIGKERIRRTGKTIIKESPTVDVGFRVLKIDNSNMADVYYAPDALDKAKFDLFVDNIKPDRTPEDLLFQVMLDWGVDLALPITKQSIQDKDVFFVDGNVLAACFDASGSIDEAFVKELAKQQPLRVVFRDAGYKNSAVKINVEQIFKLLSPATEVKCI
jgi:adenine-specific DNA-methyltransferase